MPIPVTLVFGVLGEVIVAVPDKTLQLPTPMVGVLPANTVVLEFAHSVCEAPALDTIGILSTCMAIVEVEAGHTPLDIVHCNMLLVPVGTLVIVVFGVLGEVMTPPPVITLQVPIPTVGVFPARVVLFVLIHKV